MRILVAACTLALLGCEKHTELTVEGIKPGPAARELSKLLTVLGHGQATMRTESSGVRLVYKYQLPASERSKIDAGFARLKKSKPVKPPLLRMRVTEKREEILKQMSLKPGQQHEFPIHLKVDQGKPELRRKKIGPSEEILCTYNIPTKGSLPNMTFQLRVPKDMPPGPKRLFLKTLSKVPFTAGHKLVAAVPELRGAMKKIEFVNRNSLTFIIDKESHYGGPVFEHKVGECLEKTFKTSSDAFVVNLMFPNLAAAMSGHKFTDV